MMRRGLKRLTFALLGIAALFGNGSVAADDFYQGKQITLYVGTAPGGVYDVYARLIARHLGKHIPGHPSVVLSFMPGATGRTLMGFMYGIAPKDGTAIAVTMRSVPFDPLMGVDSRFDARRAFWLGSTNSETGLCIAWHTSPIKTLDDAMQQQMIVGTSGAGSTDSFLPTAMNSLLGTKFKVVAGYLSTNEIHMAIERGEVQGRCGMTWNFLTSAKADWLREMFVAPIG